MKFKKIPDTSLERYISGWEALNVVDENGLSADWHPLKFWLAYNDDDEIPLFSNPILGSNGIKKRKIKYSDELVYIADFPRAIADLIYTDDKTDSLVNASTDFLTDEEAKVLFKYLLKILKFKDIEAYIIHEFPKYYYDWKYENTHATISTSKKQG